MRSVISHRSNSTNTPVSVSDGMRPMMRGRDVFLGAQAETACELLVDFDGGAGSGGHGPDRVAWFLYGWRRELGQRPNHTRGDQMRYVFDAGTLMKTERHAAPASSRAVRAVP